jgi:hypothetical protein
LRATGLIYLISSILGLLFGALLIYVQFIFPEGGIPMFGYAGIVMSLFSLVWLFKFRKVRRVLEDEIADRTYEKPEEGFVSEVDREEPEAIVLTRKIGAESGSKVEPKAVTLPAWRKSVLLALGLITFAAAFYLMFFHRYTFPPKESLEVLSGVVKTVEGDQVHRSQWRYFVTLNNHPGKFTYEEWFPWARRNRKVVEPGKGEGIKLDRVKGWEQSRFQEEVKAGDKVKIWVDTKGDNWICQIEKYLNVLISYEDVKKKTESEKRTSSIIGGVLALIASLTFLGFYLNIRKL